MYRMFEIFNPSTKEIKEEKYVIITYLLSLSEAPIVIQNLSSNQSIVLYQNLKSIKSVWIGLFDIMFYIATKFVKFKI